MFKVDYFIGISLCNALTFIEKVCNGQIVYETNFIHSSNHTTMKKTLLVLSFALCASFAFAQSAAQETLSSRR